MVQKVDCFFYIPFLQMLQLILSKSDIQHEVTCNRTNASVLQDYCDGSLYKSHPLFSVNNEALQVVAYFDEIEIANPLGSYVAKHKLGCLFLVWAILTLVIDLRICRRFLLL